MVEFRRCCKCSRSLFEFLCCGVACCSFSRIRHESQATWRAVVLHRVVGRHRIDRNAHAAVLVARSRCAGAPDQAGSEIARRYRVVVRASFSGHGAGAHQRCPEGSAIGPQPRSARQADADSRPWVGVAPRAKIGLVTCSPHHWGATDTTRARRLEGSNTQPPTWAAPALSAGPRSATSRPMPAPGSTRSRRACPSC